MELSISLKRKVKLVAKRSHSRRSYRLIGDPQVGYQSGRQLDENIDLQCSHRDVPVSGFITTAPTGVASS